MAADMATQVEWQHAGHCVTDDIGIQCGDRPVQVDSARWLGRRCWEDGRMRTVRGLLAAPEAMRGVQRVAGIELRRGTHRRQAHGARDADRRQLDADVSQSACDVLLEGAQCQGLAGRLLSNKSWQACGPRAGCGPVYAGPLGIIGNDVMFIMQCPTKL